MGLSHSNSYHATQHLPLIPAQLRHPLGGNAETELMHQFNGTHIAFMS